MALPVPRLSRDRVASAVWVVLGVDQPGPEVVTQAPAASTHWVAYSYDLVSAVPCWTALLFFTPMVVVPGVTTVDAVGTGDRTFVLVAVPPSHVQAPAFPAVTTLTPT